MTVLNRGAVNRLFHRTGIFPEIGGSFGLSRTVARPVAGRVRRSPTRSSAGTALERHRRRALPDSPDGRGSQRWTNESEPPRYLQLPRGFGPSGPSHVRVYIDRATPAGPGDPVSRLALPPMRGASEVCPDLHERLHPLSAGARAVSPTTGRTVRALPAPCRATARLDGPSTTRDRVDQRAGGDFGPGGRIRGPRSTTRVPLPRSPCRPNSQPPPGEMAPYLREWRWSLHGPLRATGVVLARTQPPLRLPVRVLSGRDFRRGPAAGGT